MRDSSTRSASLKRAQLSGASASDPQPVGSEAECRCVGLLGGVRRRGVRDNRRLAFAPEPFGNRRALGGGFVGQPRRIGHEIDVTRDVTVEAGAILVGGRVGGSQMALAQRGSVRGWLT